MTVSWKEVPTIQTCKTALCLKLALNILQIESLVVFTCPICDKKLRSASGFSNHTRVHKPTEKLNGSDYRKEGVAGAIDKPDSSAGQGGGGPSFA
ncbi:uncharacterized protein LOC144357409 [Saccoglossus kowalevskii]